jgi:hypothetical protein
LHLTSGSTGSIHFMFLCFFLFPSTESSLTPTALLLKHTFTTFLSPCSVWVEAVGRRFSSADSRLFGAGTSRMRRYSHVPHSSWDVTCGGAPSCVWVEGVGRGSSSADPRLFGGGGTHARDALLICLILLGTSPVRGVLWSFPPCPARIFPLLSELSWGALTWWGVPPPRLGQEGCSIPRSGRIKVGGTLVYTVPATRG